MRPVTRLGTRKRRARSEGSPAQQSSSWDENQEEDQQESPAGVNTWEGAWKSHTRLPRECARFDEQTVYEKPSHLLSDLIQNLPPREALNEDQKLFFLRFDVILDKVLLEDCVGVLLL